LLLLFGQQLAIDLKIERVGAAQLFHLVGHLADLAATHDVPTKLGQHAVGLAWKPRRRHPVDDGPPFFGLLVIQIVRGVGPLDRLKRWRSRFGHKRVRRFAATLDHA
jgi:hypothetical protein